MSKYIDAEKLKATLKTRIAAGLDGYGGNLKWLLEIIDSLQQEQPEMDLEKEIEVCWETYLKDAFGMPIEGRITKYEVEEIARHFYALGINA